MNPKLYITIGALFGLFAGFVIGTANGALGLLIFTAVGAVVGFAIYPITSSRTQVTRHKDDNA